MIWALAWRNVWRNRRRSLLTLSSIALGLAAVMFGESFIRSFQRQMIDKATGVMLGHLQVQRRGARDRKIPELLLQDPERFRPALAADPRVAAAGARLLFTALVYSAGASRGVLVCGVEPEAERGLSILPSYLVEGRYLGGASGASSTASPGDRGRGGLPPPGRRDLVLGAKLAGELDARLGERIVIMAQRPGGEMTSELFRLAGVYRSGSAIYDRDVVYVPLDSARRLRGQEGLGSHLALRLRDAGDIEPFLADWGPRLGDPDAALLSYADVGSEIIGIKRFQDGMLAVVLIVIFSIVGLGIMNTLSMAFYERVREFGTLRAMGAKPGLVVRLLAAEAALLGALGTAAGLALGWAAIRAGGAYGLPLPLTEAMAYFIPFDRVVFLRPVWRMHLESCLGVFAVCMAASLLPALKASRLRVAAALRAV